MGDGGATAGEEFCGFTLRETYGKVDKVRSNNTILALFDLESMKGTHFHLDESRQS